ncbi:DUF7554 family protein [Natronorubrum thiooxidans]|uniref:Uncharacterized protein n=1 Tax=Natronorubrum thiooxidans TaxID=308853 RepID=A0A1N7GQP3_9EURY|nr:hypothetical protein [Natronorubrum thiooxidans]SIS14876.1 hypothetical protein SAMN05421752_11467 [Natronorubrum thiooxidans]
MFDIRGELEVDTLLKIVLGLVAVLLVLQILQTLVSGIASLLGPFFLLVQIAIAVLIVLWLVDRI